LSLRGRRRASHFFGVTSGGRAAHQTRLNALERQIDEAERRMADGLRLQGQLLSYQESLTKEVERLRTERVPVRVSESEPTASARESVETASMPTPQLQLEDLGAEAEPAAALPEMPNAPIAEASYAALESGMEYGQVVDALGREEDGTLRYGPANGGRMETRIWRWRDPDGAPIELTLRFVDGVLEGKSCSAPWAADPETLSGAAE
jgi:hypothetical protein